MWGAIAVLILFCTGCTSGTLVDGQSRLGPGDAGTGGSGAGGASGNPSTPLNPGPFTEDDYTSMEPRCAELGDVCVYSEVLNAPAYTWDNGFRATPVDGMVKRGNPYPLRDGEAENGGWEPTSSSEPGLPATLPLTYVAEKDGSGGNTKVASATFLPTGNNTRVCYRHYERLSADYVYDSPANAPCESDKQSQPLQYRYFNDPSTGNDDAYPDLHWAWGSQTFLTYTAHGFARAGQTQGCAAWNLALASGSPDRAWFKEAWCGVETCVDGDLDDPQNGLFVEAWIWQVGRPDRVLHWARQELGVPTNGGCTPGGRPDEIPAVGMIVNAHRAGNDPQCVGSRYVTLVMQAHWGDGQWSPIDRIGADCGMEPSSPRCSTPD